MTTRSDQLLTLRSHEQKSHGYTSSSRWYIHLNNAIHYLALAETAANSLDRFRNAWASIYNLFMMDHQAGEMENLSLSRWVSAVGPDPRLQLQAERFPTSLLQAIDSAKQDVLWNAELKKWRDARQLVQTWLQQRQSGKALAPSKTCSYAFTVGRDLRNALSHPTLNPAKASIRKVYDLAASFYIDLAEAAIRATIEHPQPNTTGRMIAYRFFLYPYLKNSDSFLSDYYLERLLPGDELDAFPEDDSKTQLKGLADEMAGRRSALLPATEVETTIADWCQPVLFPALGLDPQGGVTIVAEDSVYEPSFVLPANGAAAQPEYHGKAAGKDLACLLWVLPWRTGLDAAAEGEAFPGLSTTEVAQQALLQSDVPWAILTNGHRLRLLHKASAHRPRAFLEVDLDTVAARRNEPQARQAFRYLQCFFSGSSFLARDGQERTRLERILTESERHGKEIGDELKQNVFKALEELGEGFLYLMGQEPARVQQWQQRAGNGMPIAAYLLSDELFKTIYEESLALMYRLLFLFYAESRDLLPMHDELYRDTYSLEALRDDIISVHDDPDKAHRFFSAGSASLDERLRELFQMVNEGFGALVPAYNGGLFDPEKHPFLEHFRVGDYYLARAIDLLSRTRPKTNNVGGEGRKKVTYRDLDVRHLGEIYEGLLEYSAHIAPEQQVIFERTKGGSKYEEYVAASQLSAAERRQVEQYRQAYAEDPDLPRLPAGCKVAGIKEKGQYFLVYGGKESKRRSTGSYYTPDYIVQYIVENTLGPLVRGENREGALKDRPLHADDILELKVLDPAMGSGHFLVAATEYLARAYGQALIREGRDRDGAMDDKEFIRYKRLVAERCIYGVDINPMAVELAKLSMWLFTMDPQRPLSFLDHHLKCGNSLVGAWIKDLGTRPGVKPNPLQPNLFEHHFMARVPMMIGHVLEIVSHETVSSQDVETKKALDNAIEDIRKPFRNVAHAWTGVFFGDSIDDYERYLMDLEAAKYRESSPALDFGFFHWELEFPEVWFDGNARYRIDPGFDAVIGNPPYANLQTLDDFTKLVYLPRCPKWKSFYRGQADIHYYFIKQSLDVLANGGCLGFITSRYWIEATYADHLRKAIATSAAELTIIDLNNNPVFEQVSIHAAILFSQKGQMPGNVRYRAGLDGESAIDVLNREYWITADIRNLDRRAWSFKKVQSTNLRDLTEGFPRLSAEFRVGMGVSTGLNEAFYVSAAQASQLESKAIRRLIKNSDIVRYAIIPRDTRLVFTVGIDDPASVPTVLQHLAPYRQRLEKRRGCDSEERWFKYKEEQNYDLAENFEVRVITSYRGAFPRFAIAPRYWHGCTDTYSLVPHQHASKWDVYSLLAILNSSFIRRFFQDHGKKKGGIIEFLTRPIQSLPIPVTCPADLSYRALEMSRIAAELVDLLAPNPRLLEAMREPTYVDCLEALQWIGHKIAQAEALCKALVDLEKAVDEQVWDLYDPDHAFLTD